MSINSSTNPIIIENWKTKQNRGTNYFAKAMFKMMLGLLVTAATSYLCVSSGVALYVAGAFARYGFLLLLAITLLYGAMNASMTRNIIDRNASPSVVNAIFYLHAVLEGCLISPLILFSTGSNVATAFFASASLFAFLAVTSLKSESRNFLSFGRMISGVAFALMIAAFINVFLRSDVVSLVISAVAIVICAVAVIYDVQWMKMLFDNCGEDERQNDKFATMAAMMLHSNVINMFWHILRILGHFSRRKD